MPIFEYRCTLCEHTFEVLQTGSKENNITCPKCGSDKVEKIPTAPAGLTMSSEGGCPPNSPFS